MIPPEIVDSLKILSAQPLGGGSINQVYKITSDQGIFCLKVNRANLFPQMFETEAKGLDLLRSARALRIPEVITVQQTAHYAYILLEFIAGAPRRSTFMKDFGISLAELHRHTAAKFGLDHNNYMGSLAQSNSLHDDWVSFFIEERLEKQVSIASDAGLLTIAHARSFQQLYRRLETFFPAEKPSLIHGDLWSGNFIVSETGSACLIDPAVYYGHRETDIAMTTLFGGFGNDFYTSYQEAYPMENGWEKRLEVFNLYPLLIHLNLFGQAYLGSILSVLKKF